MKKSLKIFSIFMIAAMIIITNINVVSAISGVTIATPSNASGVENVGSQILGIIQLIGNFVAVGVLLILGIKYMMGSAEEKAEYKKTMIPYIIGAVLIFAAVNIATVVSNFAAGIKM